MAESRAKQADLSPRSLMRILGDFANSQILDASIEYDFFTLIDSGFHTADEIARQARTDPRATRIVLDSLLATALVQKRNGLYQLTSAISGMLRWLCGTEWLISKNPLKPENPLAAWTPAPRFRSGKNSFSGSL
jgi:hypothetical protein